MISSFKRMKDDSVMGSLKLFEKDSVVKIGGYDTN